MAPPEVNPQIKARGKDVHWYKADIGDVSESARRLLENYSGISPDEVVPHIAQVVSLTISPQTSLLQMAERMPGTNQPLPPERSRLGHISLSLHRPMPFP